LLEEKATTLFSLRVLVVLLSCSSQAIRHLRRAHHGHGGTPVYGCRPRAHNADVGYGEEELMSRFVGDLLHYAGVVDSWLPSSNHPCACHHGFRCYIQCFDLLHMCIIFAPMLRMCSWNVGWARQQCWMYLYFFLEIVTWFLRVTCCSKEIGICYI
jgi:hypothetical protein